MDDRLPTTPGERGAFCGPCAPVQSTHTRELDLLEAATGLVGVSSAMRRVRETLRTYAVTSATVLVTGETGTGKELAARAIHTLSPRARRPFVAANIAALPGTLLLSELFGHERGAFTGALARHRGLFEQAHGGTILLDEIGELTPECQTALLRVLETRRVRAVGAEREHAVDVRLVVATHRDLATLVRRGLFRQDLYFRLNGLVVRLPALRDRKADIRELAPYLLERLRPEVGEHHLDPSALRLLSDYPWPGNVRQLVNVLFRAAVLFRGSSLMTAQDILAALTDESVAPPRSTPSLDENDAPMVASILRVENGSVSASARRLGVARSTLRGYLLRFKVANERPP